MAITEMKKKVHRLYICVYIRILYICIVYEIVLVRAAIVARSIRSIHDVQGAAHNIIYIIIIIIVCPASVSCNNNMIHSSYNAAHLSRGCA